VKAKGEVRLRSPECLGSVRQAAGAEVQFADFKVRWAGLIELIDNGR